MIENTLPESSAMEEFNGESMSESPTMEKTMLKFPTMKKTVTESP